MIPAFLSYLSLNSLNLSYSAKYITRPSRSQTSPKLKYDLKPLNKGHTGFIAPTRG